MTDQERTAVVPHEPKDLAILEEMPGDDVYSGISSAPVSDAQAVILSSPVNPDEVEVRPDGQIYYPEMKYRILLNKAFGPAGWGMRPMGQPMVREPLVLQQWAMYAGGRFISVATGECQLVESNQQMTYGDVLEGTKSVAIRRLCKDLGIASELWDKKYVANFLKTYCVKVWTEKSKKPLWRRLDSEPFYGETTCSDDSPNKDKYVKIGNVGGKAKKIIDEARRENEHDQRTEGEKINNAVKTPVASSPSPQTQAPAPEEYTEGVLKYRKAVDGLEVSFNGKWMPAGTQIGKELTQKIISLFKNEFEAKNHVKKHFKGNDSVSTLTYEEAVAVYEWKKNGKADTRWYKDKIEDDGKKKSTSQDLISRLQKNGLTGSDKSLVVKWAKEFNWPQPYTFDKKAVDLLTEVCVLLENGTYKLSNADDVAELDKMVSEAWK